MPRTALAVGTHAVSEVQMAEMDTTQNRVREVGQGGGRTLSFSEMTVIDCRFFTDL